MWTKPRSSWWLHSDGAIIVKWVGLGYLLYRSYEEYQAVDGDFKTFSKLSEAKNEVNKKHP